MAYRPSLLVLLRLYYCLSMLSIHVPRAGSLSFELQFSLPRSPADPSQLIACTGDAYLSPDTLELTRNRRDQSSRNSTGRAKYKKPVPLWDGGTGEMASFTSTFSFRITPDYSSAPFPGDGMAFFLGHFESDIPPSSAGGSLGLLTRFTNGTGDGTIVAVEFGNFLNPPYGDISYNHVGIDVNSLNSTASTDTTSPTKNLTSGHTVTATVRYQNVTQSLAVEVDIDGALYNVSATVYLRSYLPEQVAVGFSAATGDAGTEQHQVFSWSFTSTLEPKTAPATEAPAPPPTSKHPKRLAILLISLLVSLLLLLVLGFLLLWKKRKGRYTYRDDDSDGEELDDMESRVVLERGVLAASGPRRYTYRELAAATDNFADDGKLGRGGFGSVYRGKLMIAADGGKRPVAIKVLSPESSAQGRKEFEAEVRIISRLKHRNLVQLLGWCDSRRGLLLVYELVADGSLDNLVDKLLYNPTLRHASPL